MWLLYGGSVPRRSDYVNLAFFFTSIIESTMMIKYTDIYDILAKKGKSEEKANGECMQD